MKIRLTIDLVDSPLDLKIKIKIFNFVSLDYLFIIIFFMKKKKTCRCGYCFGSLKPGYIWCGAHLDNNGVRVGPGNYEAWGGAKKRSPVKKKILKNYFTYGFCYKLLIKLLYSIFFNKFCSIDNMVNLFNISCDIVERR